LITPYPQELEVQMQELYNRLPEKNRRLYAGIEALKLPYGGVSYIARLFNCARDTVLLGIQELNEEETLPRDRNRREGGGRTAIVDQDSTLDDVFLLLLQEHTAGNPMDETVKWTDLTCADISVYLTEKGFKISRNIVRKLLKKHGYVKRKALKKSPLESTKTVMLNFNESTN